MEHGIVAFHDSETHRSLLTEAAARADAADAPLVVVRFLDPDEYDQRLDTLESVGRVEHVEYDADAVLEGIATDTKDLIQSVYDEAGVDVETEVVVAVAEGGDEAEKFLQAGEKRDCDHAFVTGRGRSPAGKALFGDVAQQVIINFDGFVTSLVD